MNKPLPQDRPAKSKMIAERLFLRQRGLFVRKSCGTLHLADNRVERTIGMLR